MNNDLYIDLSKIVKFDGASIEIEKEFPKEIFQDSSIALQFLTPVTLAGRITNLASNITINGKLTFSVSHECDKCLETFIENYELDFIEDIAKPNSLLDDYIPYSNNKVLFSDAIYKAIFSEMPDRHVCKLDCKGLCGQCGCNLNLESCNCFENEIDPRLLKLKEFFN